MTDSSTKQPKKKQQSGATFAAQQQTVRRTPTAEAAPTSIAQDVPNIKQIWDLSDDGETLTLNFHPGQSKAYLCDKRYTIVLAGTQGGKCLTSNVHLKMADGNTRSIRDVRPGDKIVRLGSDQRLHRSPVTNWGYMGRQTVFRVELVSGRSVEATSEHPFYTPSGWLPLNDIRAGNYLGVPDATSSWSLTDVQWDRVAAIIPQGLQDTWDIEVAEGRNFIANDIFCHNTSFGPWWMYKQVLKYGSADYLAVTSSFELFKLKMGPMLRETFITILGIGRWWAGDRLIELANPATKKFGVGAPWGRIILRSAVNKSGLESATAAAAWLDEAGQNEFSLDVWDAVIRRLSLYQGPVLVTTTIYNLGWLKYYIYDPWVKGEWPNMEIIQFPSTMNPGFGQDEFEQRKRKMQSHRFAMQYEGRFTDIPGQIYHLPPAQRITPFKPGDRWPRSCGVDFGAVNTATLWIAYDEHGAAGYGREVYFIYRAVVKGGKTTHDHAKAMQAEYDFPWLVAAFGGSPSEEQQRRDWMFEGVPMSRPPVWDVEAGIDRVTYAIREQRLYVMDDPTDAGLQQVIWEFDNYRRETNEYGEVMERIEGKAAFHLMDALRYVMSGVIYYGENEGNVMEHPMA